ncbi:LSU ribosomal protein L33P [Bacillus oleivorans]|uniref:Large ribosomal subunit protein bL33 n=1 Tax=Bacillus oleivorans TaxID=1448271 RepID=A0A285D3N8_9BACI|nr:LSU ribosomal protein L33P [Bacillus oleivorans]
MHERVALAYTETGDRNYITTKNKRNTPERIELKKYSPRPTAPYISSGN